MRQPPRKPLTTYSCRAELESDAIVAMYVIGLAMRDRPDERCYRFVLDNDGTAGAHVQFQSTLSRAELLALFAYVDDAHVMQETLRPCPIAENSMDRDGSVTAPPLDPNTHQRITAALAQREWNRVDRGLASYRFV